MSIGATECRAASRMAALAVTEQAEEDVAGILRYTLERWGEQQYWEYAALIEEALVAVAQDPLRGRSRPETRAGMLAFHVKQPGRNARHVLFYAHDAVRDRVTVVRVLHDSMDFERHLP